MLKMTYDISDRFLPPYSPFFNTIEKSFNKLKNFVLKSPFKNIGELEQAILANLSNIKKNDAEGFYFKVQNYY